MKAPKLKDWALYDLATDPSESIDIASANPTILEKLVALAKEAHEPAVEGTFARLDRHQRDRRAKLGKHDEPEPANPKAKTNANTSV